MYDLIIVGAGAAGSLAAIMASDSNLNILVCDCNQIIGRKLLSTGNGRCNFTNTDLNIDNFYSNDSSIVEDIIRGFDSDAIIDYFKKLGIYSKENNTYVYPITNSAATVQKVIADKILGSSRVNFISDNVIDIKKHNNTFTIFLSQQGEFEGKKVLISTGGLAKPSLGNNKNGLKIAKRFGHTVNNTLPALVHLKSSSKLLVKLAKQRVHAKVILKKNDVLTDYSDVGEVQFNKDNISGIPVMNISSHAASMLCVGDDVKLIVDFVPFLEETELLDELKHRIASNRGLEGLIPEKTIDALNVRSISGRPLNEIVLLLKKTEFIITDTGSFEDAQVMRGGIPLSEIKADSLESKLVDGLFFAGEILDVDARCGGYNLTFAFATAKRVMDAIINDQNR